MSWVYLLCTYPQSLPLADPLANMEAGEVVERMDQKGQTAEAAALSNGFSRLAENIARTEVSQDTCMVCVCVCAV
jgi:hypothetical protein